VHPVESGADRFELASVAVIDDGGDERQLPVSASGAAAARVLVARMSASLKSVGRLGGGPLGRPAARPSA